MVVSIRLNALLSCKYRIARIHRLLFCVHALCNRLNLRNFFSDEAGSVALARRYLYLMAPLRVMLYHWREYLRKILFTWSF